MVAMLRETAFKLAHRTQMQFQCPICDYCGPFRAISPSTGKRLHARCARCGALERHRLQHLVLAEVISKLDPGRMRMLHFAPEEFFRDRFKSTFGHYQTADLSMHGVDHHVDIQSMPFESGSYDIVYASHVLEHVPDDRSAISEIRRILAPGGLAILPVPIVSEATVEYPEPNANESMHVRAPGPDYYDRYRRSFATVDLYASDAFPERNQVFTYEDRSFVDREKSLRLPMPGARHRDIVPVCYA